LRAILKPNKEVGLQYVTDAPEPKITQSTDVLIKVRATAICGTDLDIYKSDPDLIARMTKVMPVITGHEFCGDVVEIGSSVKRTKVGDFVSAEMHILCGECYNCRTGNGHVCINTVIKGIDANGCFAEYVVVPESNIVILPADFPEEVGAYMDAIGNAIHTITPIELATKRVAVLGAGPIGIIGAAAAKICGAREVIVTDINDMLLKFALENGVDKVFNVSTPEGRQSFIETCRSESIYKGVDVVIEMSGHPSAYEDLFQCVRMGGEVVLLGLPKRPLTVNFTRDIIFKGLTIHGIIGRRTYDTWFRMIGLMQAGLLPTLKRVVTHRIPLKDFQKGFDVKLKGEGLKIVMNPR
jgi:threonine 3-dehydrogenase